MEKHPDFEVRRAEVAEQLPCRFWWQKRGGVVFDNNAFVDADVHRLSRERFAEEAHHYRDVAIDSMSFRDQDTLERQAVNELSIAESELSMDDVKRLDNGA